GRQAADFTRTHGRRVRDVMTEDVISVSPDSPLEKVVEIMEENRIKRVAVAENRRVVGVVSRADLLRALVGRARTAPAASTDDRSIREAILEALDKASWAPATSLNVIVADGVVDLWGTITDENERRAICVVAENVAGVTKVHDHMVFVEPYSGTIIEAPEPKA
ncbi:MAG: CBS domain-containing protein, partial [Acetobacteraceae bacterium]